MSLRILSREGMSKLKNSFGVQYLLENHKVISINDRDMGYLFGDIQHENLLSMYFADCDLDRYDLSSFPAHWMHQVKDDLFSPAQADTIIEFLKNVGDKPLLIHCYAGVFRSGATGFFASKLLDREIHPTDLARITECTGPNGFVLRILQEQYAKQTSKAQ